ncbi:unnamed protein product [Scytosiphon promiscuus]
MSIDRAQSARAPKLDVELSGDMMWGLSQFSQKFGRKAMTQQSLKALQCIPIVWSALAVKESQTMAGVMRDDSMMSKCMQEIAVPGTIKLLDEAISSSNGTLVFPQGWRDALYYTTLGTGKSPKVTFLQHRQALQKRFRAIKTEYTKTAQLWFDTHEQDAAKMLSGTNSQDALEALNSGVYKFSDAAKRASSKEDAAVADFLRPPPATSATPAADAALAATALQPIAPASGTGASGDDGSPAALARAAAASARRELSGGEGVQGDSRDDDSAPSGYFFPFLLLACMWTPWGGQTPSEWKHLMASDGPTNKRKVPPATELDLDDTSPVFSPKAITRLNANGDALSRRQHYAAVKQEKEAEKRALADKENKEARKEVIETKKKGSAVLQEANAHVGQLSANIKRIVELKEASAAAQARAGKIQALEKKLMMMIGDEEENKAALVALLDEC